MNYILSVKFIRSLLSEPSQINNEEMKCAYEDFVAQVLTLHQTETDCSRIFRILHLTRIEYDSIGLSSLYEQGEKCLSENVLTKGIICD